MCVSRLIDYLEMINEFNKDITEQMNSINRECFNDNSEFVLSITSNCKILCLTKLKKKSEICRHTLDKLTEFEGMVQLRIKNHLERAVNAVFDNREHMDDREYLIRMNELKDLNEFLVMVEEADHN
jgi:hypothetical protein